MSSLTIEVEDPTDAYENLRAMLDAAPVEFSQITAVRLELEYESTTETDGDAAATVPDGAVNPSIADAEGGTVDDAPVSDDDDGLSDAAEKISFLHPGEGDDDDGGDDGAESIFGAPNDPTDGDSVFAAPDETAVAFDEGHDDADPAVDAERTAVDGSTLGDPVERSTSDSPTDASMRGTSETATEDDQSPTAPTATEESAGRSDSKRPSTRTYNKVMRLLQNRDFPIERAEIEDVAVGAYNVDAEECRAIVDAAIEKGLVAQQGSKLVDPTE